MGRDFCELEICIISPYRYSNGWETVAGLRDWFQSDPERNKDLADEHFVQCCEGVSHEVSVSVETRAACVEEEKEAE